VRPAESEGCRTFIAPISSGLGDLVVSLPAVHSLLEHCGSGGGETWLVARSDGQVALASRISGLSGCVDEGVLDRRPRDGDRVVDLRDHPLQRDHWWGSAEFDAAYGPLSINDILARICEDFDIEVDLSWPRPLFSLPRPELEGTVVLVAETDSSAKRWAPEGWVAVAHGLRSGGARVVQMTRDRPGPEMEATGIEAVRCPTPGDAVDVLSSCAAVVGVDTGMTHVAVQQGTPTVAIYRPRPVYFRPWPHCRAVVGDECDEACVTLERAYAYNDRVRLSGFGWSPRPCPVGGRCLAGVTPERVLGAMEELAWGT
jgi:Glycosyltransferase family 9 (heptosyltransferase)